MRHPRRRTAVVAVVASLLLALLGAPAASATRTRPVPTQTTYAALGDSYPAGDFLAPGERAYPELIAGATGGVTLDARSGMTVRDLRGALTAEPPDAAVRWVTLTIGANDTGWSATLLACAVQGSACDYAAVVRELNARIDSLAPELPQLVRDLHRAYPRAKIYWSGYVRLFGPSSLTATCSVDVAGLGTVAVPAVAGVTLDATVLHLNARIAGAVLAGRLSWIPVTYVAADPRFAGHRYCDGDPWFATLHPNAHGQVAYMKAFAAAGMPTG